MIPVAHLSFLLLHLVIIGDLTSSGCLVATSCPLIAVVLLHGHIWLLSEATILSVTLDLHRLLLLDRHLISGLLHWLGMDTRRLGSLEELLILTGPPVVLEPVDEVLEWDKVLLMEVETERSHLDKLSQDFILRHVC